MPKPWERFQKNEAPPVKKGGPWERFAASEVNTQPDTEPTGSGSTAYDVASAAASGMDYGIAETLGLPVDLFTGGMNMLLPEAWEIQNPVGGSASMRSAMDLITGGEFQPQTQAGEFAHTAGKLAGEQVPFIAAPWLAGARAAAAPVKASQAATDVSAMQGLGKAFVEPYMANAGKALAIEGGMGAGTSLAGAAAEQSGLPVEAGTIGLPLALAAPIGAAKLGGVFTRGGKAVAKELSGAGAQDRAIGHVLAQSEMSKDELLAAIKEAEDLAAGTGFKPTLSEAVDNAGIHTMTGKAKGGERSGEFQITENNNQQALREQLEKLTPEGNPATMQEAMAGDRVKTLTPLDEQAASADAMYTQMEGKTHPNRSPNEIGAAAREKIEASEKALHNEVQQAIKESQNRKYVDVSSILEEPWMRERVEKILGTKRVEELRGAMVEEDLPAVVTHEEADELLNLIRFDMHQKAPLSGGTYPDWRRLKDIEGELTAGMAPENLEARKQWGKYKNLYEEGAVGDVRKKSDRHEYLKPNEKAVSHLLQTEEGFKRAAKAAGGLDAIKDDVADTLRVEFRQKVLGGGDATAKSAAFFERYQHVFRDMPDLKQELAEIGGQKLKAQTAKGEADTARKTWDSAFGSVVGSDPEKALNKVMAKPDATKQLQALSSKVEGNPEAKKGLRRALVDWIKTKGGHIEGAQTFKPEQMKKAILQNREAMKAAGFKDEEIADFTRAANLIERYQNAINKTKLRGRSNTAQDSLGVHLTPFDMEGKGAVSGKVLKFLLITPNPMEAGSSVRRMQASQYEAGRKAITALGATLSRGTRRANLILDQMLVDAEFAKLLLMDYTPSTQKVVDRKIWNYLKSGATHAKAGAAHMTKHAAERSGQAAH